MKRTLTALVLVLIMVVTASAQLFFETPGMIFTTEKLTPVYLDASAIPELVMAMKAEGKNGFLRLLQNGRVNCLTDKDRCVIVKTDPENSHRAWIRINGVDGQWLVLKRFLIPTKQ